MKSNRRRILSSIVVGGTLATGFALNSNIVNAEEIQEPVEETVTAISQDVVQKGVDQSQSMQTIDDALEVVEGDAVAEASYLDKANEHIENETLTNEIAEELLDGGKAVLVQAQEKAEVVKDEYANVKEKLEESEEKFVEEATRNDLTDCVEKCDVTESSEEKIEIIKEAQSVINDEYNTYMSEHGTESDEYKTVVIEVEKAEKELEAATLKNEEEKNNYNEVLSTSKDIIDEYEDVQMKECRYRSGYQCMEEDLHLLEARNPGDPGELIDDEDYIYYNGLIDEKNKEKKESEDRQKDLIDALDKEENEEVRLEYDNEVKRYDEIITELSDYVFFRDMAIDNYNSLREEYVLWKNEYDILSKNYNDKKAIYENWKESLGDSYDRIIADGKIAKEKLIEAEKTYNWSCANLYEKQNAYEEASMKEYVINSEIEKRTTLFNQFNSAAEIYINALSEEIEAGKALRLSDEKLEEIRNNYRKLNEVIESYKKQSKDAGDESYGEYRKDININTRIDNCINGYSAVVEGVISIKSNVCEKKANQIALMVKGGIQNIKVGMSAFVKVKIYKGQKLITTLYDKVNLAFNFLCKKW